MTDTDPMPVFTIKAKDALAPIAIEAYAMACRQWGLDGQEMEVRLALDEILDWQGRNRAETRLPDHKHVPVAAPAQETNPVVTPCPEGFHWIGQTFASCDRCGLPAWEHEGTAVPRAVMLSPYDDSPFVLKPWEPGEREACRAKWDPAQAMARGLNTAVTSC